MRNERIRSSWQGSLTASFDGKDAGGPLHLKKNNLFVILAAISLHTSQLTKLMQRLPLPGNALSLKAKIKTPFRRGTPEQELLAVAPCMYRKPLPSSLGQPRA